MQQTARYEVKNAAIVVSKRPWVACAVAIMLVASATCARRIDNVTRPPDTQLVRTMPNPDGCYMQAWDRAQYTGQSDYINGPRTYADLRNMPNQANWEKRIASVRVGPTAVGTAFTEPKLAGTSFQFGQRAEFATLPDRVNGRIASMQIRCVAASEGKR